jgi:hypothetical protein
MATMLKQMLADPQNANLLDDEALRLIRVLLREIETKKTPPVSYSEAREGLERVRRLHREFKAYCARARRGGTMV